MARRAEEEENHWPGFVDALSTIVMVVTFLLIILVVVIVVLSQQVNPEGQTIDATEESLVAELEQEIVELQETVSEQSEVIEETTETVSEQSEIIEEQSEAISELQNKSQNTSVSDAGDTAQVQSDAPISEIEIVVPRVDTNIAEINLKSEVETAQAIMTVKYEENAVEMDPDSAQKALEFLQENGVPDGEQDVLIMSYFDGTSVSVSQAKRTAYYRLLAVRNAVLDSGVSGRRVEIVVAPAAENPNGSSDINKVKVFLQ